MDTTKKIISAITTNTELKGMFKNGNVILYNRSLKAKLTDICKEFGTNDDLLITYEMSKTEKNLDIGNTKNITLIFNVWSKESQTIADNIEVILEDIMEELDGDEIEIFELNGYQNIDPTYYRQTLQTSFISFVK